MGLSYPGSIDSVQRAAVGTISRFRSETLGEGEFIYLAGAANVVEGDVCSYEIDYNASVATSTVTRWAGTANMPLPLGVSTAATVADTWGWYQISGSAVVRSNGSISGGDDLFWQATGRVSASSVDGKQMLNAVAASANGVPDTNQVVVTIDRPLAQGANNPAVASSLVVGTTTISGGTTGNVLYDNAGVVGERAGISILGSGVGGSVSSGTAETQLASISVPAGAMGANGILRVTCRWTFTNSGNNKTMRVRLGGSGGVAYLAQVVTTTLINQTQTIIWNVNSASVQEGYPATVANPFTGASAGAFVTGALDTSVATTVYISGQPASGGETITLRGYLVELLPGA